jgi:glycerate dehydrogenase
MRAVFLDFGTVDAGDLSPASLQRVLPDLQLLTTTAQDDVASRIAGCEVVLTNKLRLTRELIASCPSLRWIGLTATGTDNVDLLAARERGIGVCNIRDYCTQSVAQHVLGVVLALTHRYRDYHRVATDGTWSSRAQFTMLDYPIRELRGRMLGVVGWGVLGRAVAQACEHGLGMRVIVAERIGERPTPARDGVPRVPLDALLEQSDVITLHCPLTPLTRGLIGAAQLARMKPDALLVNTARGALIDLPALVAALRAGRLGGAAIDVLPVEPPVDGSPLFAANIPNLWVTPHVAWAALEARQRALDTLASNLAKAFAGDASGRVV